MFVGTPLLRTYRCRGCGTSIGWNYELAGGRCTPCHEAWLASELELQKAKREQRIAEIEEGVRRALESMKEEYVP